MANHKWCTLSQALIYVLSFSSMIVVESARLGLSHETSPHSPSYPQLQDFPNEQLYHAYFVIQRFKNTITCDPSNITSTWTGNDICGERSYIGFHCASQQGGDGHNLTVTSAIFNGFGLCAPKLQGFLDQLPDLAHFQATSNSFGGSVPSLAILSNKMYSHNVLSGWAAKLSDKYTKLGPRHYTDLGLEGATATLNSPGDLIDSLTHPGDNIITASLPNSKSPSSASSEELGFPKMSYLALANNKLTGPIPPSIADARDTLLEVLLLNNQLSGCLPHELGMLTKAAVIDAGMNQLTGPIPSSFSCLSSVEQLNLGGNRLYDQVPEALCKLASPAGRLANLTLSDNYFTSVAPACAALIKDGVLNVKNNCIPGFASQRHPAECAAFQSQPKTCPAATTQVTCPAAAANGVVAPGERKARDYSSYVTYATLHD